MIDRRAAALFCLIALGLVHCRDASLEPSPCEDAIAPIAEGFGARGSRGFIERIFPNPDRPSQHVVVWLPRGGKGPAPVIFFAHAYGTADPRSYTGLLGHMASRGLAVVFSPYGMDSTEHADRYEVLWSGIAEAARRFPGRLDLGRIGIVGHSYGAGAAPFLAHRALVEKRWGADGAFLLLMAPWYPLRISPRQMSALPEHVKALVVVFEDDRVNDHRIAVELFHALPVPASEKDYVIFRSDAHGECELPAVHSVPQSRGLAARDDALDRRGLFRLFDALAAYAFEGDAEGKRVALGKGAPEQVFMGRWRDGPAVRPLLVPSEPRPVAAESAYLFRHSDAAEWARYGEPGVR